tara:strand:- start:1494 stop:2243 length:750 start_codon:yes stop_codon:yes gene_type:complete
MEIEDEIKYWQEHKDEYWEEINKEHWKKVKGCDTYSISTFGNLRNDKTNYLMQPSTDKNKYKHAVLYENKLANYYLVHRLVAQAFIPNPNNYSDVDHLDKKNKINLVSELRWVPHIVNCRGDNREKGEIGSIKKCGNSWRARFKYDYKEYSRTRQSKEEVENWLENRRYELMNELPLTEIDTEPVGGVTKCKNSWRMRVTYNNWRYSKNCKTEEDGKKLLKYIIKNIMNKNIETKEDADIYYEMYKNPL